MLFRASRRNPFSVSILPLLGRLHRNSFRSGNSKGSSIGRFLSRMLFYPWRALSFTPVHGELDVIIQDSFHTVFFDVRNRQFSAIYFDVFSEGYEPEFTTIIDALLPDEGVFLDIGSNWGFFSIFLASRIGFRGHIHAFEPWPATHLDLLSLIDSLDLRRVVTCHNEALSDVSGFANMESPGHSGLAHISDGQKGEEIRTTTLDEMELSSADLIKIDAEGLEDKILKGGQRFLKECKPMILFENRTKRFGDDNCLEVLFMLEEMGYKLFAPHLVHISDQENQVEFIPLTADTRSNFAEYPNLFACHLNELNNMINLSIK